MSIVFPNYYDANRASTVVADNFVSVYNLVRNLAWFFYLVYLRYKPMDKLLKVMSVLVTLIGFFASLVTLEGYMRNAIHQREFKPKINSTNAETISGEAVMKVTKYELGLSSDGKNQILLVANNKSLESLPPDIQERLLKNPKPLNTLDLKAGEIYIALNTDEAMAAIKEQGYFIANYRIEITVTTSIPN